MKQVIFKRNNVLYMTNERNYNSIIPDASALTRLEDFENFDEVADYLVKYTKISREDIIDKTAYCEWLHV